MEKEKGRREIKNQLDFCSLENFMSRRNTKDTDKSKLLYSENKYILLNEVKKRFLEKLELR
jgi:hypothetical protein